MSDATHSRFRRLRPPLMAAGLVSALLLAGCGGGGADLEVLASSPLPVPTSAPAASPPTTPAPPPTTPAQAATTPEAAATNATFQGEVAEVDVTTGALVMDVQIVWMPVLEAYPHQRRVVVDTQTLWDPAPGGLELLHLGENVQVEGESTPEGDWRALTIQLFDID